jgi:hypothetical protein
MINPAILAPEAGRPVTFPHPIVPAAFDEQIAPDKHIRLLCDTLPDHRHLHPP